MKNFILQELKTIQDCLAVVTDRIDSKDRISDCLLREVMQCVDNIRDEMAKDDANERG